MKGDLWETEPARLVKCHYHQTSVPLDVSAYVPNWGVPDCPDCRAKWRRGEIDSGAVRPAMARRLAREVARRSGCFGLLVSRSPGEDK